MIESYALANLRIPAHVSKMLPLYRVLSPFFRLMRKVWIYKRANIKGWWVGWYESGKRKTKALPSKALAEHYRQIKYTQLNSDVFIGTVTVDWQQMVDEYQHSKKNHRQSRRFNL